MVWNMKSAADGSIIATSQLVVIALCRLGRNWSLFYHGSFDRLFCLFVFVAKIHDSRRKEKVV